MPWACPGVTTAGLSIADQWKVEVATLSSQMLALHGMPLPSICTSDFTAKTIDLYNRIPSLSDAEIRTGMSALAASIQDPHTDVM